MARVRAYRPASDHQVVDRFLREIYVAGDHLVAWLQPRWEYMHGHPLVENVRLDTIGIAEEDGRLVGVVNPEHSQAFTHLQIRPGAEDVAGDLIDWAVAHQGGGSEALGTGLGLYVDDMADTVRAAAIERGFAPTEFGEPHSRRTLAGTVDVPALPPGYRLQSLADGNDLAKINRVLWRGFGHPGPAPDEEIPGRARVQSTPNFRRDLNLVAVAPDGEYAAYAGIWRVPDSSAAMVEPVATDPDHRRLGLGRALVLEALRRAQTEGATVAWVGSDLPFYEDLGFEVVMHATLWWRSG